MGSDLKLCSPRFCIPSTLHYTVDNSLPLELCIRCRSSPAHCFVGCLVLVLQPAFGAPKDPHGNELPADMTSGRLDTILADEEQEMAAVNEQQGAAAAAAHTSHGGDDNSNTHQTSTGMQYMEQPPLPVSAVPRRCDSDAEAEPAVRSAYVEGLQVSGDVSSAAGAGAHGYDVVDDHEAEHGDVHAIPSYKGRGSVVTQGHVNGHVDNGTETGQQYEPGGDDDGQQQHQALQQEEADEQLT